MVLLWTLWCRYVFSLESSSSFPDKYPGVGLLDYMVNFRFLRNIHSVLHSDSTDFHSYQQCRRAHFSPHSPAFIICGLFGDGHSDRRKAIDPSLWFWFAFLYLLAMWRVFSCACWLSVCLLRRNVYLGLLPAFGLGCFFYVKLYEPFMYFGLLVSFAQSVVSDPLPPLEQPHTGPQASLSFTVSWSVLTLNVHRVGDAIQPSHPLPSPSTPAFNLSEHQGLSQWVSCSYQGAKVLELHLQHQSFQFWMLTVRHLDCLQTFSCILKAVFLCGLWFPFLCKTL